MTLATLENESVDVLVGANTTCPLCRSSNESRKLFQKHSVWIEECPDCEHRFARAPEPTSHVATVYGDEYFHGGGAGYSNYLSESRLLRAHGRRYGRLLKQYSHTGRLLDVGAAAGFVLQGLCDEGWHGVGVEPNAKMAQFAREQLNMAVSAGSLEEYDSLAPFDAVSLIQVMAHFVELQPAMRALRRLVATDGICVVETWNVRSWSATLFQSNWHEYSPPSVLQWFSPASLRKLFARYGFREVATGRPQKWIEVGHARSLLAHTGQSSLVGRMLGKAFSVFPEHWQLPYPAEDLFWSVFRKVS